MPVAVRVAPALATFAAHIGAATHAAAASVPSVSVPCPLPQGCAVLQPSSLGQSLADALLRESVAWITAGASWVARRAVELAVAPTTIDLGAQWLVSLEPLVAGVVMVVALPLALAGTIGAIVHQDTRRLLRVWAVGVPISLAGGGVAVTLAALSVDAVNELCGVIVPSGSAETFVLDGVSRLAVAPEAVQLLVAGLILFAAVALWLELVLRSASVYLSVFFLPVALATLIWPAVAPAARRFVEVLAALILSKLVVVGALAVGLALGATGGGAGGTVTAAAVLLLAAFAPFALLRLVPIVETGGIAHLEGLARRPARAAQRAASAASYGMQAPAMLDHLVNRDAGGLDLSETPPQLPWVPRSYHPGDDDSADQLDAG